MLATIAFLNTTTNDQFVGCQESRLESVLTFQDMKESLFLHFWAGTSVLAPTGVSGACWHRDASNVSHLRYEQRAPWIHCSSFSAPLPLSTPLRLPWQGNWPIEDVEITGESLARLVRSLEWD